MSMAVRVEAWEGGAALRVKARPAARGESVSGVRDGMLCLAVAAVPEKGKANKAIARLLAKTLGVPPGAVTLLSGGGGRHKRFGVGGLGTEELRDRLEKALAGSPRTAN